MTDLATVAPAFVEMAHRIVWATVAMVDPEGRPRTRVLHPIWEWDGGTLTGPDTPAFGGLRLAPTWLRVFPGTLLLQGSGELLTWRA